MRQKSQNLELLSDMTSSIYIVEHEIKGSA